MDKIRIRNAQAAQPVTSQFLTRRDAAQYLNVSVFTVDRLIAAGRLKGYKLNGHWRFKSIDLEACLVPCSA